MIGGLMKRGSIFAVAAAASIFSTSAMAADLGGDCCADLEERVAELEATTARKGNRKVSLSVSGHVNELMYWWDNGDERNVYIGTSGFTSSRFRFKGDAKISDDWSAGYLMELEVVSAQVNSNTASNDDGSGTNVRLRHSAWYLQSKRLGKFTMGHTSFAADDIQSSIQVGGTPTATQGNIEGAPGMALNFGNTAVTVFNVFDVRDVDRGNLIRYDSPSLAGFVLSAAWGEDDRWDVALRYAGEFNGIKIAAGIGYHQDTEPEQGQPVNYNELRMAGGVLHVPTGLFVEGGYLHREFDETEGQRLRVGNIRDDFDYWYLHAGIFRKFIALGKTSFFGEYGHVEGSAQTSVRNFNDNEGRYYGIGVNQYIDAAAMEIYLGWRHFEADLVNANNVNLNPDDVDTVYTGARISF